MTLTARLSLTLGLFLVSSARALTPIEDPERLLERIAETRSPRSFSENFRVGDRADVTILSDQCTYFCQDGLCGAICMGEAPLDVKKELAENDTETATAVFSHGRTEVYVREELAAFGGSTLKKSLSELDVFVGANVRVKLTRLSSIDYRFANGTSIPAYDLFGELIFPEGVIPLRYTVAKDLPGIVEILFMQVGDGFGVSKVFRVKGFTRGAGR